MANPTVTGRSLRTLPPKQSTETETAWVDPWVAAEEAQEKITGQAITDAINADPEEVALLRAARQQAREGKTTPWRTVAKFD